MLIEVHFVPDELMPGHWVHVTRPDGSHIVLLAREVYADITAEQAQQHTREFLAARAA